MAVQANPKALSSAVAVRFALPEALAGRVHREILGLEVTSSEDDAGWLAVLRWLAARGLSAVQLVTSDAHLGIVDAIGSCCRGHPGSGAGALRAQPGHQGAQVRPWVATLVRTIFEQPGAASVLAQHAQVVAALDARFPAAAAHLDEAGDDLPAFIAFAREIWRQVWSNKPLRHELLLDRREVEYLALWAVEPA